VDVVEQAFAHEATGVRLIDLRSVAPGAHVIAHDH
jgi:hypothetical protein